MDSFERYAGFFPEEALAMMERQEERSHAPRDPGPPSAAWLNLPAGAWADAILPDVVDGRPPSPAGAPSPAWWKTAADLTQRFRAAFVRA